jgi:hypothetical protein
VGDGNPLEDLEQPGLFLKTCSGCRVQTVLESGGREPSVRERDEGTETRGTAVEVGGGR